MGECLFEEYLENQKRNLELVSSPEEQLRTLIVSTLEQTALWAGFAYLTFDIWSEMDRKGEQDTFRLLKTGVLERTVDVISEYVRDAQAYGVFEGSDQRAVEYARRHFECASLNDESGRNASANFSNVVGGFCVGWSTVRATFGMTRC